MPTLKRKGKKDQELLAAIEDPEASVQCILHTHFEKLGFWDYPGVLAESRRLYELLISKQPLVIDDTEDSLLAATAAAARTGAFAHIGAALGVDGRALELAVSHWCEEREKARYHRPVRPDALVAKAREYERWLTAIHAGVYQPPIRPFKRTEQAQ